MCPALRVSPKVSVALPTPIHVGFYRRIPRAFLSLGRTVANAAHPLSLCQGEDTMDVWFDSGSSWAGVLQSTEGLAYPANLYLEGSDQHRGAKGSNSPGARHPGGRARQGSLDVPCVALWGALLASVEILCPVSSSAGALVALPTLC